MPTDARAKKVKTQLIWRTIPLLRVRLCKHWANYGHFTSLNNADCGRSLSVSRAIQDIYPLNTSLNCNRHRFLYLVASSDSGVIYTKSAFKIHPGSEFRHGRLSHEVFRIGPGFLQRVLCFSSAFRRFVGHLNVGSGHVLMPYAVRSQWHKKPWGYPTG